MENKIYIGDNNDVLSDLILQYQNKIKMVYIDPPYNTKTIKSYNDNIDDWNSSFTKIIDKLHLLLTDNGLLFISIDDNKYADCKIICDKIFNNKNYIGTFITKQSQRSNSKLINIVHEYILCYGKNKDLIKPFKVKRIDIPEDSKIIDYITKTVKKEFKENGLDRASEILRKLIMKYKLENDIKWLKNYRNVDSEGEVYHPMDLSVPGNPRYVDIPSINLYLEPLKTRSWTSDSKFIELYNKKRLIFINDRPYEKRYLKETENNVPSILNYYSRQGTEDLKRLELNDIFDTPKPVELIKFLIRISSLNDGDIVLDCYAGSGTTAQAVIEINREDKKKISYILVQKKELITKGTKCYDKCIELKIQPYISEIMKLRIDTVYEIYKEKINYELINH